MPERGDHIPTICVACRLTLTTVKCGRGVVLCSCADPSGMRTNADGRESVRGWLRWIGRKLQEWLLHAGILRVVMQDRQELVPSPLLHPIP